MLDQLVLGHWLKETGSRVISITSKETQGPQVDKTEVNLDSLYTQIVV